jgi:hypothetical protein
LNFSSRSSTRRRWLIAIAMLGCATVLVAINVHRHSVRVAQLDAEIHTDGGRFVPDLPLWDRTWLRFRGKYHGYGTGVILVRRPSTAQWIRSWDYLSDLRIRTLELDDSTGLGAEVAVLAERHPLKSLAAPRVNSADRIADVLADKAELETVVLKGADLTDAGLQRLPLERLHNLNVAGTLVTGRGLRALNRCQHLRFIILDGRQFNAELAEHWLEIEDTTNAYDLILSGPDVTDETVNLVLSVQQRATKQKLLNLWLDQDTTATLEGAREWRRQLPAIHLEAPHLPL